MEKETLKLKCAACGAVVSGEESTCSYCGAGLFDSKGKRINLSEEDETEQKIIDLLHEGNKLGAVKIYKDQSGKGLKESKDYVENLAKSKGIEFKSGCFVATACYGNYNAPEVMVLREYRDKNLLSSASGRKFVKFYYAVSPFFALLLERSTLLRLFTRKLFLGPVISRIKKKNIF